MKVIRYDGGAPCGGGAHVFGREKGSALPAHDLGHQGSRLRALGLGLWVLSFGFWVQGSGFRVQGLGYQGRQV